MSLMNTVAKLAVGFAMAKGMEAVQRQGGIGSVLEGLTQSAGARQAGGTGGLGDLLNQLGGSGRSGGAGGLGDLLGQLVGAGGAGGRGGLDQMLGQLTGSSGRMASPGSLGGLLGGLATARGGADAGDFAHLVNEDNPAEEPDETETARLMLRAMTQAANADGALDASEREKLLGALQAGDPQDVEVVQAMLDAPVDPASLAADTPRGLETQVYSMALNAIDPDNAAETRFLHSLATGLGLGPDKIDRLHDGFGAARLSR